MQNTLTKKDGRPRWLWRIVRPVCIWAWPKAYRDMKLKEASLDFHALLIEQALREMNTALDAGDKQTFDDAMHRHQLLLKRFAYECGA